MQNNFIDTFYDMRPGVECEQQCEALLFPGGTSMPGLRWENPPQQSLVYGRVHVQGLVTSCPPLTLSPLSLSLLNPNACGLGS